MQLIDNRYQIIKKLGEGGMGAVYLAEDQRLGRKVAIKRLRLIGASDEVYAQFLERFRREAREMARLQHPSIITLHDYGVDDSGAYLVMEYLSNGTLKDRMDSPKSVLESIQLIEPIAEALQYLHDRGIVHRDIKPANILFDENNRSMLADFGIVKLLGGDTETLTATGAAIGTPAYMAPELIAGDAGPQTDQYALAVVFFELVTGKKPFQGRTPMETMTMQKYEPLPDPRSLVPGLAQSTCSFLKKALAKASEERFSDMKTFIQDMYKQENRIPEVEEQTIIDEETILIPDALRSTPPEETNLPDKKNRLPLSLQGEAGRGSKNLPRWLFWSAGGVAILIVILIFVLSGSSGSVKSTPTLSGLAMQLTEESAGVEQTSISTTPTAMPSSTPTKTSTPTMPPTPTLGIGSTMIREKDGMEMVYVPAGEFTMGSEDGDEDEQPVHDVVLEAYWIDKFEITNRQYEQCVEEGACGTPSSVKSYTRNNYYGNEAYQDYPVIYVSREQSQAYCEWVGGKLPTEAEWEKAARGIDERSYPWGNENPICSLVNYGGKNGCVGDTSKVGSYPSGASPYGALDMAGNVWEWVADWYDEDYYNDSLSENPTGPTTGSSRVLRGGSWYHQVNSMRTSYRVRIYPYVTYDLSFGFRCAFESQPSAQSETVSEEISATPTETPPAPILDIGSAMLRDKDGMEMVYVPAGNFTMGNEHRSDEKPVHEVYLDAYWIDKFEVTNGQYEQCVTDGVCSNPCTIYSYNQSCKDYYEDEDYQNNPVIITHWLSAENYCEWIGGRLPTEAEWEKAARGTDERMFPWGNESPDCTFANFSGCTGGTSEVGSYPKGASPYGALDMAGNVWEWVADWYDEDYYSQSPLENPTGPASGGQRVLRGGSWAHEEANMWSFDRLRGFSGSEFSFYGFRCVVESQQ
ncbi:MAG: SUMF1/EgtB/PvdO family nonheme iron enzyme [Anaerolineaceae bacterium]|nr:SUMF1/EgtB/PvdO family nonheme iron enzyme [Anaerolineaceae bacterium]